MKKTVSIIQTRLTHYRVPLFQKLREDLAKHGIHLNLIHGRTIGSEAKKNDTGYLDWAIQVDNVSLKLWGMEILWQPALKYLNNSDLVVVSQENRILLNYLLLARKVFNNQKIAFWGHGKNFQNPNPRHPKELFKHFFLNRPDWWFAYTALTDKILLKAKYPASKITVLNNAIDTSELRAFAKSISEDKLCSLRNNLGITGKHIGVFCGSLYSGKRIDILIAAARQVRKRINDFELVVIGAGPDEYLVNEAVKALPWIHYVGPRFGYEKVLYMKLGQVFLLPYIVGLAILDSFALGIPVVTMVDGNHSPEIAYLCHEKNGIITSNSIEDYTNAICILFNDPDKCSAIVGQCLADANYYTIENMVAKFTDGIVKCLSS
jgi:L-malate glycosyltransferase